MYRGWGGGGGGRAGYGGWVGRDECACVCTCVLYVRVYICLYIHIHACMSVSVHSLVLALNCKAVYIMRLYSPLHSAYHCKQQGPPVKVTLLSTRKLI